MKIPSPLVIASHNEGKVREIGELLAPFAIEVTSSGRLNLVEPEETGDSFIANAEIKSRSAFGLSGHAALADDSGLAIPDLDGAPGIYSARWAGEKKDFSVAMERVHRELAAKGLTPQGRPAYFVCALSLCLPDGTVKNFQGEIWGTLTFPARGDKGFGYDPIFIPDGYSQTFAELDPQEKNRISHRARAFEQFVAFIKEAFE